MELSDNGHTSGEYGDVLMEYLRERSEQALLRASDLSRRFVDHGLGPEDVVALHFEAFDQILHHVAYREQARAIGDSYHFLLETMITYGVRYKDFLELKLERAVADAEQRALQDRARVVEAEKSQHEAREILARVSHELRNLLTTVRGNLDMTARALGQGRQEKATDFVTTAIEAVDRLSRLASDLVEASRGFTPTMQFATVNLEAIVVQACSWASVGAANKGIALDCIGGDPAIWVNANFDALLSVFGNILSNAIRYTPPGGHVNVRVSADEATARVDIVDSGLGMSPEVKARIFEKFYRSPDARGVEAQGLGLGLSLVEQMVSAHGGRVEVESALGSGSTFRVILARVHPQLEVA